MALTIAPDRKHPQGQASQAKVHLTSVSSGYLKLDVKIGSIARLADDLPLGGAIPTHARNLPKHDLASIDAKPLSQRTRCAKKAQSIFGPYLEPTESVADHGWTRFDPNIALNFAKIVKAEYGENVNSPITIACHPPMPAVKDEATFRDSTLNLFQIPSSAEAIGDFGAGEFASTRGSSASQRETKLLKHQTKIFKSFQDRLDWILPKNTVPRLLEDSNCCVNENIRPKKRCSLRIKMPCKGYIEIESMLRRINISLSEDALIKSILDLLSKFLCTRHLNERRPGLLEICDNLSTMPNDEKIALRGWVKDLLQTSRTEEKESLFSRNTSAKTRSRTAEEPFIVAKGSAKLSQDGPFTRSMAAQQRKHGPTPCAPAPHVSRATCIQQWRAYRPNAAHAPSTLIENLLTRSLKKSEKASGYIYMYWCPPNFGHLKIGLTKKTPEKRFKRWETQCKRPVEDANRHSRFVKHVALVEKLVHAELRDLRVQETDCVCGIVHQEWFIIKPAQALKVLDKFAKYMDQAHYETDEADSHEGLKPNKDILETHLTQLCQLTDISLTESVIGPKPDPRRQSKGRRRSSQGVQLGNSKK